MKRATILAAVVLLVATGCNGDDPQPPTGRVEISDATPVEAQMLTVKRAFSDANGIQSGTIVFHWQTQLPFAPANEPWAWEDVSSGE
jgi:hypothetical protein